MLLQGRIRTETSKLGSGRCDCATACGQQCCIATRATHDEPPVFEQESKTFLETVNVLPVRRAGVTSITDQDVSELVRDDRVPHNKPSHVVSSMSGRITDCK